MIYRKREWVVSDEYKCPKCKGKTEILTGTGFDKIEYNLAERCPRCKWFINFEDKK